MPPYEEASCHSDEASSNIISGDQIKIKFMYNVT